MYGRKLLEDTPLSEPIYQCPVHGILYDVLIKMRDGVECKFCPICWYEAIDEILTPMVEAKLSPLEEP